MTILLFLRFGLDNYISHFCQGSNSADVRDFGLLYDDYSKLNRKPSLSQIQHFTNEINKIAGGELCVTAITSILTGSELIHPDHILLTQHLLDFHD